MQIRDSVWVFLGFLILVATFFLCGERAVKTPAPVAMQMPVEAPPPAPRAVEPPVPSSVPPPAVLKQKIDELLIANTIQFQTNSAVLLPEGMAVLNGIAPILQEDQTVAVEISGHTDNVGSDQDNIILSEDRAKAVAEYLVTRGVAAERLTYIGYGASQPVADNATVEGRSQNRRIEFSVRSKGEQP